MIGLKHFIGLALLTASVATGGQTVSGPAPAQAVVSSTVLPAPASGSMSEFAALKAGEAIPPAALEAFVDGFVRSGMAQHNVAGVTVSVVQNGQTVLLKGYGIDGIKPLRAVDPRRSLFRIGSVSKTMTWIAILREVEKGRLNLNDPVNQHLPPELHVPDQGFKQPIRVVDLMAHATGMEDSALGHLFFDDPARILPPAEYLARHRPDRVREGGTLSTYSNYGVALAGHIVARLNGTDFETVADRDIFAPLGMTRSSFREPYPARAGLPQPMSPLLAADVSEGFRWSGGQFRPMGFDYITSVAAAGSISTTAEDMARYMTMLLRDGELGDVRIFSPASAALFRKPIMAVPEGVNGWTHGFATARMPGGYAAFGHGGGTSSFFTSMMVIPDLNLGVFISTNTVGGGAVSGPLPAAIVERFYAQTPPILRAGNPALVSQAGNYQGNYVATRRSYSGLEKFVAMLVAVSKVSVTPDGHLITSGSSGAQSWVPAGQPGRFQASNGEQLLSFALDSDGRATRMYHASGANAFDRAGPLVDPNVLLVSASLVALAAFGMWTVALTGRSTPAPGPMRRLSSYALLAAGALWLVSIIALSTWLPAFGGSGRAIHDWPATPLVLASSAALAATIATVVSAALLVAGLLRPAGGAAPTLAATLRQLVAIVLFLWLSFLVAIRGGLIPWA